MNSDLNRESATIYQFPVGGRRAFGAGRRELSTTDTQRVNAVAIGSSWYHDEAIREADRGSEH